MPLPGSAALPAQQQAPAALVRERWWSLTAKRMAVALLLVAAVAAAIYWFRSGTATAREYVTQVADSGSVAPTVVASGTVNPVTTVQVGSYVSGVIQTLSCDFNTRVKAGQTCAMIDPRPYQTAVDQAEANVATARAQLAKDRSNLAFAKLILDRDTSLLARSIVSQETVDTAANAYQQAQSQIALDEATIRQHQASLDAARVNLGYTRIVSPVDGTVVSRSVTQGQTVAASFQTPTLFLIATDLTKMQVDTNVSESDIGRIAEGNQARFSVEAFPDRAFVGRVTQVRQAPQTVQNVITYDVVVSVPNPQLLLRPGMTASVHIETQRRDGVLRVPDQALRFTPTGFAEAATAARTAPVRRDARAAAAGEAHVWVLRNGTGSAPQRVDVLVGLDDDSYAEIVQGDLHAGDQVIVAERSGTTNADSARPASTGPRF